MAKIRGTRSRQATGDGWPEAVIRWVRAIGNPKLLRAQSKLFSWTRLDLGQPTPVAFARNGPGGSDIGTGEGSDGGPGGGKGVAGPRASWRWTLGQNKMGDKTQSQVPTANLTMQFHSHSVAAAERRPTPGVKCNGLMEPGKITSAQGVSEPASPGSHRGGQAAAPAQRRREAREPTGPSNPSAVTGRAQYEEFTRYRFEHGGMGQAFLHLHFASHHPGACSAQSHPPLFE